jgi:hypothetical protein
VSPGASMRMCVPRGRTRCLVPYKKIGVCDMTPSFVCSELRTKKNRSIDIDDLR